TDPTDKSWDKDRLAKAVEYADKVAGYTLNNDFTHLYGKTYESTQQEHIFTIHHDGDEFDAQGNHQAHCAFTFAFEITKETHIGPADVELYTAPRWADSNDVRREFSYTTRLNNPLESNREYKFEPPTTLARFGKGIDRSYANSVNICLLTNEVDRIELRYAEVLLTKAEALLEQGGKDGEALNYLNLIRSRAGVSQLTGLSGDELRTALRTEWEHEFVYDQRRWFDLVRWKTLISTVQSVSGFTHYADEYETALTTGTAAEKESSAFFAKVYKHLHAKHDNVRGKHYRFPIPLGESMEELGITQNPGY
ncbi:MAG: RagB/SusD family nutrient uptake outer membrane protein, partial [Prevotellaceae bacterium]|nr:RagB/SusD family nutrient uptake outer membrane protein [Prevotellaceae bacterium]